ncbi:hypothetical protein ACTFIV_007757 [Dictyostelium citrinum]
MIIVDVGDSEQVDNVINDILHENQDIKNIDSIYHFAFTQVACKVQEINMKHLDISHSAKTMGAINLHNQSIKRNWKLINFVMASSTLSLIGSTDLYYGADSLVIVQLKNWIDQEIGTNLITIQQLQNNTISTSIKLILNSLIKKR